MKLPSWLSLSRPTHAVVGAAASQCSDPCETPGMRPTMATSISASPAVGHHLPLHSDSGIHARLSTPTDEATQDSERDDPSGKHKPAPPAPLVPVREAVEGFLRLHGLAVLYSGVSLCVIVLMVYLSFFAASMDDDNATKPEFLSCRSWAFGDSCGLWGFDCRPFQTDWAAIRCRSRCNLDQSSSLSVWGTGKYHANSRICRAAIHAGVIGPNGGCALMRYSGPANSFTGSNANGVTSQSYLSWFPKTIEFEAAPSSYCTDLTWPILVVGTLLCAGFALLPRTNAAMLFATLVGWGFFYVRLVGQPQSVDYAGIAINSFGEVFVLLAASSWLFLLAPKHTFARWGTLSLRQRVVLWSGCYIVPYSVFLNMNMFAYIPWLSFGLGGYEDSNANAGTYVVVALLVLIIGYCAFRFLRELYRQRVWRRVVMWYGVVSAFLIVTWAMFHSTDFHLHHTMVGVLLLPFTRFPTPLAAAAQSALLGVFVQGYAAWGWSSYLDTVPTYLTIDKPDKATVKDITDSSANFSWKRIDDVDGYSLRLNKVEVYRGTETHALVDGLQPNVTYFVTVAAVAAWGTDGQDGPKSNFTTLPHRADGEIGDQPNPRNLLQLQ